MKQNKKLMEEIPDRFWGLFRSVNRSTYIEALLRINEEYEYSNYFLSREVCIQVLSEYFAKKRYVIWQDELEDFAASLQKKLEEGETKLGFPVSVAVGWSREDECGIDLAFRRADFTMYEKKQQMKREREQDETRLEPSECGCGGIKNETE